PLKRMVEIGDTVKIGQVIAMREGFGEMPIHASISGQVTAIKKAWHLSGKMVDAIEITNDHTHTFADSVQPQNEPEKLEKAELIAKMKACGLSGLGGAGFPTYIKYQTKCPIDTVIINAVECEPYMTCDCQLIDLQAERMVKGLHYMMKAAGAEQGFIAYKEYNHSIREAVSSHLDRYPGITCFPIQDVYPAGWEKYIVEQITHKTYPKLPSQVGVIVNNAATAIVYADMVEHNIPLIRRVVTISGEGIKEPKNFLVPIGTSVQDLIRLSGGYREGLDPKDAWFVAGGPMTGRAILIDDLVVSDTLGSVLVLDKPHDVAHPECLGCGRCADVCPVFLTPTEIQRGFERKDVPAIKRLNADKCMQCGLCSYVCPSHIEITDYVYKAKELLRKGA
ncbi:MAG: RnfABCDGE type electron transport complex subunit C, partial [Candidatus Izemoplasmatales bacterium]